MARVPASERPVLKLMYAALIRASETWKNIVITQFELRQLEQLREHLNERHVERTRAPLLSAPTAEQTRTSQPQGSGGPRLQDLPLR